MLFEGKVNDTLSSSKGEEKGEVNQVIAVKKEDEEKLLVYHTSASIE